MRRGGSLILAVLIAALPVAACDLLLRLGPPQACATPDQGYKLKDALKGFEMCLPPNWRDLRPGDPAWNAIYEARSNVEDQVAEGKIQHFAVPIEPRETDTLLNLTVYVYPAEGLTLDALADAYADQLAAMESLDPAGRERVAMPAGPAERVSSVITYDSSSGPYQVRRTAYIFVANDTAYYFDFGAYDPTSGLHVGDFESSIRSVRFDKPLATPSP